MTAANNLFPENYEAARSRFRRELAHVQPWWPSAQAGCHRLSGVEDLTIDWIRATPLERPAKTLILTTGQHGIEAYTGSAVLQVFLEEYLTWLDPRDTGLLLVHTINPWGMQHNRRTNAANVDLNRNFFWEDGSKAGEAGNPDYIRLAGLINPQRPLHNLFFNDLLFLAQLVWGLVRVGPQRLQHAALLGQRHTPQGIYYRGEEHQEESRVLMQLYREEAAAYDQIVHIDIHTGYGPRYGMQMINSVLEPRSTRELVQQTGYPRVVKADPSEFYTMQGDMVDWFYRMVQAEHPGKRLYSTAFEFGTLGDSLLAGIRSLRISILENQAYWQGVASQHIREHIEAEYRELFIPPDKRWRNRAISDARQALGGILQAEGMVRQQV